MRSAYLIHNPAAGRFHAGRQVERALGVLRGSGWDVELVKSEEQKELFDLAKKAAREECAAVFVAGGDGSVGCVASALAGSDTALGVLPSGTANVWARELGIPQLSISRRSALEEAAARLMHGRVCKVDLGRCNERAFLLWAGLGLDGAVVNDIEPRPRWAKVFATSHYVAATIRRTIAWQGMQLRVEALEKVWESEYLLAVASNIRAYAGGLLQLAPGAKMNDGMLDFYLLGGDSVSGTLWLAAQILLGRHEQAERVVHFRAAEAVFETNGEVQMHLDGEPFHPPSRICFKIWPDALRVLVPEGGMPAVLADRDDAASLRGEYGAA
jgi:diacylglycerol kinase (ATP)